MKQTKIKEAAIRSRVGERSFTRGKRYYKQGAIMSPWLQGNVLKAKCWGSMPHPYHVWVQLGADSIVAGECSCPVGSGGHCKHVAALLFTWLHDPGSFQEVEPLAEALSQRKKEDLILLIRQMIARYPELEELLYLTSPDITGSTNPINPDLIRRQVEQAIRHADYGHDYYGAAQTITAELDAIMMQADVYREREDWQNAALIYRTVLDELRNRHDQVYDHDGDLGAVFWDGSERLGECLQEMQKADARLEILRTLVDVIFEDMDVGGYGYADAAYGIVLEQATAAEKEEISTWVEGKLAQTGYLDDFSRKWRAEAYGRFLLNLQTETLTDEAYIKLCRRTGQLKDLVQRLLQLGRVDEAIADAQTASDYELLALADIFLAHDQGTVAAGLVWERAGTSNDTRLDNWLKKYAVAEGDWEEAFKYAENMFWRRPTVDGYVEMKNVAGNLGNWPDRQHDILSRLTQKEAYDLLTRIHLQENDVVTALTTLPKVKYGRDLAIDVAKAAEETHPRQAVRLYQQRAEELIAARGRGNYAQAAKHLVRVQTLYTNLKEPESWHAYIRTIRSQKPRLPALLDELRRAGL